MSQFRKAKKTVSVTVGESVRIVRELQEMSQTDLANKTGIPITEFGKDTSVLYTKSASRN